MVLVRHETTADRDAVRAVNDAAFGRASEGRVVDALRERGELEVSLVAEEDGAVVGHIAFSPAALHGDDGPRVIAALGPMAVRPDHQRRGIGSRLVVAGLDGCRRLGRGVVVVLGHPNLYPRFGFTVARPLGITCEYPVPDEAFMVAELTPRALAGHRGVVRYSPAFALATRLTHSSSPSLSLPGRGPG